MAEFTNIDLRIARDSRKWPRWKLAGEIGVSEDTLERWENGEQLPHPDDVGRIERVLEIPGIWHKWMMSHYDSYRDRHGEALGVDNLTAVIVQMRHEINDVMPLFTEIERDAIDGKIDAPEKWTKFKKETREAVASMMLAIDRIPDNI